MGRLQLALREAAVLKTSPAATSRLSRKDPTLTAGAGAAHRVDVQGFWLTVHYPRDFAPPLHWQERPLYTAAVELATLLRRWLGDEL